jgi:hypothetical protein
MRHPTHCLLARAVFCGTAALLGCTGAVSTPAPPSPGFDMAQTLSDGAQRTTLAFAGLAMMTGNLEAQSFFPPGKVADYTGFQYLRDNDPDNMGHNTSFLTRVACNVIFILNEGQLARLRELAAAQQPMIEEHGIDEQLTATAGAALCDASKGYVTSEQAAIMSSLVTTQRENLYASPTASILAVRTEIATLLRSLLATSASVDAVESRVLELSGLYGDLDGENNHAYATVFAQVYRTLTEDQKTRLAALRKSIMSGAYADGTPFDFSVCATPFLYSSVITDLGSIEPYVADTDYLFD